MKIILCLFVIYSSLHQGSPACTFPSNLQGTWLSPDKGTLTVNSTAITGYNVGTYTDLVFECEDSSGSNYVIRSNSFNVLNNGVNVVLCMSLTELSSNKYSYFILTPELEVSTGVYDRVKFISATATGVTASAECTETSVASNPMETKIILRDGTAASEKVQCPDVFLATMSYINHTTCNESYWDGCTSIEEMRFTYTLCNDTQAYSADGYVYCVYSTTSGSSGITYVYNTDSSVDDSTTFRFSCLIAESTGGYIYMSQEPGDCYQNQSSTYASSAGKTLILQTSTTCVPSTALSSEETTNAGLVAGLVIVFLILIAAAVVGGIFLYFKKFKKVEPEKKRVIDREVSNESSRKASAVTPSVVHPDVHGTSHGKLEREFTMTNRSEGTNTVEKIPLQSDNKLMPLEATGETPREQLSPLDTQLKKAQLPPIP